MKSNPTPLIIIFVIAAAIFMVENDGGPIFEPLPSTEISSGGTQNQNSNNSNTSTGTTPPNTEVKQESEYRRWINIQNRTRSRFEGAPGEESITIALSYSAPGPVDISKWQIWSVSTGNKAIIGNGLLYPKENGDGELYPIILYPGERAIVYTYVSPLQYSYKPNICFGYLNKNFPYHVARQCPYLEYSALPLPFFDRGNECRDFIENLPICDTPSDDEDYPAGITSQCQNYVESLVGYDNCVAHWNNNENFHTGNWIVHLNRTGKMYNDKNEKILLFDEKGLLVDEL